MDKRHYWSDFDKRDQEQAFELFKVLVAQTDIHLVDEVYLADRAIQLLCTFHRCYEANLREKENKLYQAVARAALGEKE